MQATGEPISTDVNREHTWFDHVDLRRLLTDGSIYPLNRPMIEVYLDSMPDRRERGGPELPQK